MITPPPQAGYIRPETVILSNQVKCLVCHSTPFSRHRHDFVECKCGNVAVDGGMEYQRLIYSDSETFEDLTIRMPASDFNVLETILSDPLQEKNASLCCDIYTDFMKYPESIKTNLLVAANWAIENRRNSIGLICAFARTYRDGEFLS